MFSPLPSNITTFSGLLLNGTKPIVSAIIDLGKEIKRLDEQFKAASETIYRLEQQEGSRQFSSKQKTTLSNGLTNVIDQIFVSNEAFVERGQTWVNNLKNNSVAQHVSSLSK